MTASEMNRAGLRLYLPIVILTAAYALVFSLGIIGGSFCLIAAAVAAFHVSGARLIGRYRTGHGKGIAVATLSWHLLFATIAVGLGFRSILLIVRHFFIEEVPPPDAVGLFGALAAVIGVGVARLVRSIRLRRIADEAAQHENAMDSAEGVPAANVLREQGVYSIPGVEDIKVLLTCAGVGGAILLDGFGFLDPAAAAILLALLLYSSVANAYVNMDILRTIRG